MCLLQRVDGIIRPIRGTTEFSAYMICMRNFYAVFSFQSLKRKGERPSAPRIIQVVIDVFIDFWLPWVISLHVWYSQFYSDRY